jgi:hypothetical protein
MQRYTFKLADDGGGIEDDTGVNLPNTESAYGYACDVARELMHHREQRTRHWRLDVYQDNGEKAFEIPFASLDQTLDHLSGEVRESVERTAWRVRSLTDTYEAAKVTVREAKSLVARSRGKPYLAADHGQKIIRDDT